MRRLASLALLAPALLAVLAPSRVAGSEPGAVEVVEVRGPIDGLLAGFVEQTLHEAAAAGSQVVILRLDSPALLSEQAARLIEGVADAPLPVAVWVGPDAVAYGGAGAVLAAADVRSAAPGARVGHLEPIVAGGPAGDGPPGVPPALLAGDVVVSDPLPGLVDLVAPSIGQLVVALDGLTVPGPGGERELSTAEPAGEGEAMRPSVPVLFREPGLPTRLVRLGVTPEAAFFLLVTGLALAAFEFYALGPGVSAAAAAVCLVLAGYGLVVLPLAWWALGLTLGGILALGADFQRGGLGLLSAGGLLALTAGGLRLVEAAPQLVPPWWAVGLTVAATGLFFGVAMTAVARARFSTPTIGREHLVGRTGRAVSDLSPEGVVAVGEARWKARAHREAALRSGDPVRVTGVRGSVLRVEPADL